MNPWPTLRECRARYPFTLGGGLSYTAGHGGTFEQEEIEVLEKETKRQGVEKLSPKMVRAILAVKRQFGGRVVEPVKQ